MATETHKPCISDQHSIPELEDLLRIKMGDSLTVEKYTATNFLLPGDNYGSFILKVDTVIRRKGKESESEELHMVAKVPPLTHYQRDYFDSPFTFKKESFMYETILPNYKKFQHDCGIKDEDIFDVGPEFYGSRLNLKSGDDFDDNAVILLENLRPRGYYVGNRYNGLDIHHSRITVQAMAKFHALGIAIKMKKPDFFEVLKVRSKCRKMKDPQEWVDVMKVLYRCIKEDPVLEKHYSVCVKALQAGDIEGSWFAVPEEPWATIIHADLWINNILFHRTKLNGQPDDSKFIDFQNYLFLSPLRELSFVPGSVVDHVVSTTYIPQLIDLYHTTFISRLETMGCDISPFTRDKFDERLSKDAFAEFRHSVFMLKVTTKNVDIDDPESNDLQSVILAHGSDEFYTRMRDLVNVYSERGWF